MREITIEEYGMARGGLWFQQMLDDGWLPASDAPEVNVQQCRDMVAIVEETDYVFYGEEGEDADETKIALQMLIACIDTTLDDWDEAVRMAMQFISEEIAP